MIRRIPITPTPPPEPKYPATRQGYLAALRAALIESPYAWTRNLDKVEEFVGKVQTAIYNLDAPGFDCTGLSGTRAWRDIGMKGMPTMSKVRALPDVPTRAHAAESPATTTDDVAGVMAKLNMTDDQWDALPPGAQRALLNANRTLGL